MTDSSQSFNNSNNPEDPANKNFKNSPAQQPNSFPNNISPLNPSTPHYIQNSEGLSPESNITETISSQQLHQVLQETLSDDQIQQIVSRYQYQSFINSPKENIQRPTQQILPPQVQSNEATQISPQQNSHWSASSIPSGLEKQSVQKDSALDPIEALAKSVSPEQLVKILRDTLAPEQIQALLEKNQEKRTETKKILKTEIPPLQNEPEIKRHSPIIPPSMPKVIVGLPEADIDALTKSISPEELQSLIKERLNDTQLKKLLETKRYWVSHSYPKTKALLNNFEQTSLNGGNIGTPQNQSNTSAYYPQSPSPTPFSPPPPASVAKPILDRDAESVYLYGGYLSQYPVGRGSGAEVFEIFHDKSRVQRMGVVKIAQKGYEKQVLRETIFAKQYIQKNIFHENMVQYVSASSADNPNPYIVMERLYPFVRKNMILEDVVCVISKIAEIVTYLHKSSLYHRDIKPGNILYSIAGNRVVPKLFDFGTFTIPGKEHESLACSPFFAAPEILRMFIGTQNGGIKLLEADMFSLGMTFLGLLRFNPYLALEPSLEERYPEALPLMSRLVAIYEYRYEELMELVRNFMLGHTWEPSFSQFYGVELEPHRKLTSLVYPLLQKMLEPDPSKRLLSVESTKELKKIFLKIFGISTEQYLMNNCRLPKGGLRY